MKALASKNTVNESLTGGQKTAKPLQTPVSPLASLPAAIHYVQRKPLCACDGGCPRCSGAIQAKLTIGQPNDKYEQEADRIADQVMRMPEPKGSLVNGHSSLVQRQAGCTGSTCNEEEEPIQTKPIGYQITPLDYVQRQEESIPEEEEEKEEEPVQAKSLTSKAPPVTSGLQSQIQSMKGGGQPLPDSTRAFFESRFDRDFSQVRVHIDGIAAEAAKSVNASAFTFGKDVVFDDWQYSPETVKGRQLMAHELTHVVQQAKNKEVHCLQGTIKVNDPNTTSPHHTQKNGDVVIGLFDKLCPDTRWQLDTNRELKPMTTGICDTAKLQKSGTKVSCECVCHFLSQSGPHVNITIHPTENNTRHAQAANTYDMNLTGKAATDIKGVQGTAGSGSPLKTVPDPAWLILGHELCGHAKTTLPYLEQPNRPVSSYYHEMTKDWDKSAVDIENLIRREHSKGGADLGIRVGEFYDPDDNIHQGSIVSLPKSMQLLKLLRKFNVPVGSHYAKCTTSPHVFYLQCPGVRHKKNLKKVPMLSRVVYREGGEFHLPYACLWKVFSKGTHFAIEGIFWHLTSKGDTKASIAAKWGVKINKLNHANKELNGIDIVAKDDPLPENISVVIPYKWAPGKQRYFFQPGNRSCEYD